MGGVFISYRRDDSQGSTGRIADRLHHLLGDDIPLFLDIDSIRPGEDFRDVISETLAQCDVTLIMIGPRWLDATDRAGNLRLEDESDLHRLEVESALASSPTTIPVLVEGAVMPGPDDLPESIRQLAFLHAAEVSVRRFAGDAAFLADLIATAVSAEPDPAPTEPPVVAADPVAAGVEPPEPEPAPEPEPSPASPTPPSPPRPSPSPPTADTPAPSEPAPAPSGPGRRVVVAGLVLAVVVLVGLVVVLTRDDGGDPPASDPAPTVTEAPAGVDVFSLEVGDCFGAVDATPVTAVEPLDCADLHPNEVYAIWDSFTATLPNDETLLEGCVARFDDVVGVPYQFSAYYVAGFWNDAESWADGDTTVICYGFVRDGEGVPIATTGSMIGSGN